MNIEQLFEDNAIRSLEADEFALFLQGAIEQGKVTPQQLNSLVSAIESLAGAVPEGK